MVLLLPAVFLLLLGVMGVHFVQVLVYHAIHPSTLVIQVLIAVLLYKIALNEYRRYRGGDGGLKP